jgi:hypothetical protein
MKTLKSDKKLNPYARKIVVPFKVNSEEMREIIKRAGAWTKGNISLYIRAAALKFKPTKEDFEK